MMAEVVGQLGGDGPVLIADGDTFARWTADGGVHVIPGHPDRHITRVGGYLVDPDAEAALAAYEDAR